ncbi:ABC transporter substrate-binding protein [Rhizobium lusitanum]|uniref:ABC transporter substrate-binding protein n=1 Tax=Rhizobium lusitanum TaxID=293958 RepID=A0A6L9UEV9_9HYPH|nr:ABC transporter substrate-binding protein [Rhizobium lusitanum]
MFTRRKVLKAGAAATAVAVVGAPFVARAQSKTAKVALISPVSGPWARQGQLQQAGAELAIKDINDAGGIKSLGGMPLELVVVDAGDTTERAKNAALRMIANYPDLVGCTGSWLSSFTLAVSEVTERAQLPMLTTSYSDQITSRGFKYIFQMPLTGEGQAVEAIPALMDVAKAAVGSTPKTAGLLADNTSSPQTLVKAIRDISFPKLGIQLKFDLIFTPPLSDATPLIQQVRSARPEFMVMIGSNLPDNKLLLEKISEFNLGGGRIPIISNGAAMTTTELLENVGADLLEGVMVTIANWEAKGQEDISARFRKQTGEAWMAQDPVSTYGDMQFFKYALEQAGKLDKEAVAQAIRATDTTDGPGRFYPGGIKFDEAGRNVKAKLVIVQWQNGVPVPVHPPENASAKAIWPQA